MALNRHELANTIGFAIWGGPASESIAVTSDQVEECYRIADAVLALDAHTDDGAAAPGPELGGAPPVRPEASEVVSGTAPSSPPRRFQLVRHVDVSGVSGTGVVAEGAEWRDGSVSLRWYGDHPSTVAWPSAEDILAVHGHNGATELVWLDDEPIDLWPTEGGPA